MKTDKRTQLLKILSDASQSISSAALANMLGTSERTVRNYIKTINEKNKTRYIRPDCFDKDAFMKKGYIETTDATGRTFYIKPFKSDAGVDNTFPRDGGGRDRHRSGKIIDGGGRRR